MVKIRTPFVAGLGAAALVGLLAMTLAPAATSPTDPGSPPLTAVEDATEEMMEAARAFVTTLGGSALETAVMSFEDEERFNWHYIPRDRLGLPFRDMTLEQRRAAHALLNSVMSSQGYLKATSIMELEEVLHILEDGAPRRDRELYYISIFGTPSMDTPWGWRLEGHHLSLNYTSVTDELVAVTPAFWGSNPAEVRSGPMAGLRVLGAEEDLARALIAVLSPEQLERAVITDTAPRDIITGSDRTARLEGFEGLPASDMSQSQRILLMRIVEEHAHNLRPELAAAHIERIRDAGIANLYFAWAGSLERGEGHYYRIHGPNVLFEYDNTQSNANHIHTVWRDLENDFGEDLLRRHHLEHAHD